MFISDFSKKTDKRYMDELSDYCRLEGLDRCLLLEQAKSSEEGVKLRKGAASPWKLIRRFIIGLQN